MTKQTFSSATEKPVSSDVSDTKNITYSQRGQCWNTWIPEIAALVFSVACTAAIAAVLAAYNGKPVPRILAGITLNAIIAILATASKSALLFSLSNSLGQLKWVWVRNDSARLLQDMEIYDDASRGPFGATKMLFMHRTRSVATAGALLIILCLTIDPFIQQVLVYGSSVDLAESPNAALSKVQGLFSDGAGFEVTQAINAALWLDDFTIRPSCPSSNCTWPNTQSVALIGECHPDDTWVLSGSCAFNLDANNSQDATRDCTATSTDGAVFDATMQLLLSEPCGVASTPGSMCGTSHQLTVPDYSVVPVSAMYEEGQKCASLPRGSCPNTTAPFLQYSVLDWSVQGPDWQLSLNATRCSLNIYLQENSTSITNGQLVTDLVRSGEMIKTYQYFGGTGGDELVYTCYDSPYEPTRDFTTFSQAMYRSLNQSIENNSTTALPVIYDITDQHPGFCIRAGMGPLYWSWPNTINPYIDIAQNLTGTVTDWGTNSSKFLPENYTSASGLDSGAMLPVSLVTSISELYYQVFQELGPVKVTDNLALSLTKMLHDSSLNTYQAFMDFPAVEKKTFNGTRTISGRVGTTVTLVEVRWLWLILPFSLSGGGVFFLVYTIYTTKRSRSPLWKSSINALFYHGLDRHPETLSKLDTISEMDRQAISTWVRLLPDEENLKANGRLVLLADREFEAPSLKSLEE